MLLSREESPCRSRVCVGRAPPAHPAPSAQDPLGGFSPWGVPLLPATEGNLANRQGCHCPGETGRWVRQPGAVGSRARDPGAESGQCGSPPHPGRLETETQGFPILGLRFRMKPESLSANRKGGMVRGEIRPEKYTEASESLTVRFEGDQRVPRCRSPSAEGETALRRGGLAKSRAACMNACWHPGPWMLDSQYCQETDRI